MNAPSAPAPTVLRWTLCLVMFGAALEYPDKLPAEVSTLTGACFLAATFAFPRLVYGHIAWPAVWFGCWLMAQVLAAVVVGSRYPGGFFVEDMIQVLQLEVLWVAFFAAAAVLMRDPAVCRSALLALVAGCLVRAVMPLAGIARTLHVEGNGETRISVLGQNPNQSAQVLAIGLLVAVGLSNLDPSARRLPRPALLGIAGTIAVGLIQTGSRGGLATLMAGLIVLLAGGGSWRARLRSLVFATLAIAAIGALAWRSDLMRGRIQKATEAGDLAQREAIFPTVLTMIAEKPVLGWGPSTNKAELAARLGDPRYGRRDPHNAILEVVSSSGVLGLIPFLLGLALCVRTAWHTRAGTYGLLPLATVAAVLTGNMSGNRLAGPMLWFALAFALSSVQRGFLAPPLLPVRPDGRVAPRAPMPVWGTPTGAGVPSGRGDEC